MKQTKIQPFDQRAAGQFIVGRLLANPTGLTHNQLASRYDALMVERLIDTLLAKNYIALTIDPLAEVGPASRIYKPTAKLIKEGRK